MLVATQKCTLLSICTVLINEGYVNSLDWSVWNGVIGVLEWSTGVSKYLILTLTLPMMQVRVFDQLKMSIKCTH